MRTRTLPTNVEFPPARRHTHAEVADLRSSLGFRQPFCYDGPVRIRKMPTSPAARHKIPDWFRWLALLWLVVWFAAYWHAWGPANFLHLCDVAVILTCIGLWTNNALLTSSQAVSSVLIDISLDPRRSRPIILRSPSDRWHRISLRRQHAALGPAALALPHRPAVDLALVAYPPGLRSPRLETTIRHLAAHPGSFAIRHSGPKSQFRRRRSLPSSLLRSSSRTPRHHFPLPRLRNLFPHTRALQSPVSAAR